MIAITVFSVMTLVPLLSRAESITVAVGDRITSADPHRVQTFADDLLARTLHTGLVQYGANGTIEPGLAESWTVSESGRVYTFVLKPNLTWSDGRPLTTDDVQEGLKRSLSVSDSVPFAAKLNLVENARAYSAGALEDESDLGVTVTDARTVVISLERSANDFLDTLASPAAMPAPARNPDAVSDGTVTSGAYVLRDLDQAVLEHRGGGPSLVFKPVPSVASAWQLIEDDDAVLTAMLPMVTTPPVGDNGDAIQRRPASALYAYGVNMARPPFTTLEVRHALAMAINRADVLSALPRNTATAATTYIPAALMGEIGSYEAPFASLTFEEREAVAGALLAEQGFGRDNPITVRLRIPLGPDHRTVAEDASRMWAVAGLNTDIVAAPFPEHWAAVARGDFDVAFMTWPGRLDAPLFFIEPLGEDAGAWNFPRYAFEDFPVRLSRAITEDRVERYIGYVREAEKAIIEDQALIALFHYQPLAIVSPRIRGWEPNVAGQHPLSTLQLETQSSGPRLTPMLAPRPVPSFGAGETMPR